MHKSQRDGWAYLSDQMIAAIRKIGPHVLHARLSISKKTLEQWIDRLNRAKLDNPKVLKMARVLEVPEEKVFQ
jgi:hypothetical protein